LKHANGVIYTQKQGPSEFGIGGSLAKWDIKNRLKEISVPTLMIGGKYDTMDPKAMEAQSKMVQKGSYLYCPNGSHLSMWDDQKVYMKGVIDFIHKVDVGANKNQSKQSIPIGAPSGMLGVCIGFQSFGFALNWSIV
jgi:proline iminopeptidase